MSDPIRGVNGAVPAQVGQTGTLATSTAAPAPAITSGATVDSADVARAEALLAAISAAAGAIPAIDQVRVAELQQALKAGIYQANPTQIAKKMSEIEALLVH